MVLKPNDKSSTKKRKINTDIPLAPIFQSAKQKDHAADSPVVSKTAGKRRAEDHNEDGTDGSPPPPKKIKNRIENLQSAAPLAEKLRPGTLDDFVGQPHLTGTDSLLMSTFANGSAGSMIFWGPPGCGKTTLARLMAHQTDSVFKELSATVAGVNEVRAVAEEAKRILALTGRRTILFLDEVHRFNKGQQDILLPAIENGQISLIGATTENPSFKLTSALISRCRVFVLNKLSDEEIRTIVSNALSRISFAEVADGHTSSQPIILAGSASASQSSTQSTQPSSLPSTSATAAFPQITPNVISSLVSLSSGDARTALSLLELAVNSGKGTSEKTLISSLSQSVSTSYDRTGDSHYDMISALHKSVRGNHADGALYWLARMLSAGEDPLYIARRMVVCSSEDIGLADPHALPLAMAALQACQVIGMPECRINLAHIVSYLAEAPKSTRAYEAYNRADQAAKESPVAPVPMQVRNAPTKLMKELGYGDDYHYNPDYVHPVHNEYVPPEHANDVFLRHVGDMTGKIWDEDALQQWEIRSNAGKQWEGRLDAGTSKN